MPPSPPFPNFASATRRSLLPSGVDEALCRELLALVEREPEAVAAQVRTWLLEDRS